GHRQEGRAEALHAGVVLVARGLVDAGLAAEFGLHRLHRHAVRLLAAVAAAFAHALVDDHARLGLEGLAAAALAAQFGGALLVVDQYRGAAGLRQHLLRFHDAVAVPDFGAARQVHAVVAAEVLGGDDDALDAVGEQLGH